MSPLFPVALIGAKSTRRGKTRVGPIDVTLDSPGPIAILGPNGAGKTTLLRLLHGLARLNHGEITWACDTETARNAQAFVFQTPILLRRSVIENLIYPLRLAGIPRTAALQRAENAAQSTNMTHLLPRAAHSLSGGEAQKLALTRALITDPKLLLLDEPTAALDGQATRDVEGILQRQKSKGTHIMFSTHDLGQARRLAEHVLFLVGGRIIENAPAASFFNDPKTPQAQAFLNGDIVE